METIDKIALLGPFIGEWKEEITSFRPFMKWICNNIKFENCYLSTHFNRKFMYDWIPNENFVPVYESLTRSEEKQRNSTHEDINTKDFSSIILKNTREVVSDTTGYLKKNILQYGMFYIKSPNTISELNKLYSKIPYEKIDCEIVFVSETDTDKEISEIALNHLEKNYSGRFVVVGDKKCMFPDKNILFKRVDYFESVYKLLVNYISSAKLVICPCGHWTLLANQQGSFVFSWGGDISGYKTNSIYGFGNANCVINTGEYKKRITSQIDWIIKKLNL